MFVKIFFLAALLQAAYTQYLTTGGNNFYYNGKQVHLSGVNIAWNSYGYDFGNGQYATNGPQLEKWIKEIHNAGGNTLRIWVHVGGDNTPRWDSNGYVTAPDASGTLINDLSRFLDVAKQNNVFVIIVLWNGAVMKNQNLINMLWDDSKLTSYIDKALTPMVNALKGKSALAAWEIFNEPEGSVNIASDSNPCYNTQNLASNGAGWSGAHVPMYRILRSVNRQAAAIKKADSKALITVGAWCELSTSSVFPNSYNYYQDTCLQQAGGQPSGTVNFYQIHTYANSGKYNSGSPFNNKDSTYKLNKPLIIGEFASSCSANQGINALWDYTYNNGYAGGLSWQYNAGGSCSDTAAQQQQGMSRIKGYNSNGVISVTI